MYALNVYAWDSKQNSAKKKLSPVRIELETFVILVLSELTCWGIINLTAVDVPIDFWA